MSASHDNEFAQLAAKQGQSSFVSEFWLFLRHNKKWWLLPILLVLALFAVLALMSGSGAAPFIYTLF